MSDQPASYKPTNETAPPKASIPLLCWDVANPLLIKHQRMASDLQAFGQLKAHFDWQIDTNLRPLLADNTTMIVTDRTAHIVWVSNGFYGLTGYQPSEALGRSPAFLQGPRTSSRSKEIVRQKLTCGQAVAVKMLNYRKEGTPYWCQIDIQPLMNSQNECTHFIAFEKEFLDGVSYKSMRT